jgi:hypothetical protein
MDDNKPQPNVPRYAPFSYAMKAVIWSFFGLRRKSDFDTDSVKLNPVHFIIAGLLGVAIFITLLISIVKFVVLK